VTTARLFLTFALIIAAALVLQRMLPAIGLSFS
jgi:hypothetical protein